MAVNVDESPFWGSRSIECFEKLEQIGEGTYGQVFMAKDKKTGETVALKKLRMDKEKEGFPITAIREMKILNKLHHENVIKLKEIVTGCKGEELGKTDGHKYKGSIYMVFEYMDHDLTGLLDRPGLRFTIPEIKCYMKQLVAALNHCHINQVVHRDIKGSNLLIDNKGYLKLAGFGLARSFSDEQNGNLTNRVITLWYRPPELLLGAKKYGTAVDMWSVGCILAELLNGKPIIQGKSEPEQLSKIFELCGTPDEMIWPGVSKIPLYHKLKPSIVMKRCVREVFRHFDKEALDLLDRMLTLDPAKRITAKEALDDDYFRCDPLPCDRTSLPTYETSHNFQTKKKRQLQRQNEEVAKRQNLQHPPQHSRLPPIQQQQQPRHWVPPEETTSPVHYAQPPPPPQPPAAAFGGPSSIVTHYPFGSPLGGGLPPMIWGHYGNQNTGGFYQDQVGGLCQGGYIGGGPYAPPLQVPVGVRAPPPYPGALAPSVIVPRGGVSGRYAWAPNISVTGHYGGSARGGGGGGRASNPARGGGNRNQLFGWQQQHRR